MRGQPDQLGQVIEPRHVAMMNTMMQETLISRHRAQGRASRAGPPPARPAPARISATPGSSATPPTSSPASGSAMTTTRRPRRRPAAACRWKSGPASCARRIRACRWRACRIRKPASAGCCRTCSSRHRKSARHRAAYRHPRKPRFRSRRSRQVAAIARRRRAHPRRRRIHRRPEPAAGLDGWLMDRLFGGRRDRS